MIQRSTQQKIRLIFQIVLSVLVFMVGICLILSCLAIYRSGESPFTGASIAAQFAKISLPVYLFLFGICFGAVLAIVMPLEEARPKARIDLAVRRKKRYEKLGNAFAQASDEIRSACARESKKRLLYRIAYAVVCVAAALPMVIYLLDLSHFTPALNQSVIAATVRVIPLVLLGGVAYPVMGWLITVSLQKELKLLESVTVQPDTEACAEVRDTEPNRQMRTTVVRAVLIVVAVVLIGLGIANGGMRDVLGKAIKICTECIGLG